MPTLEFKLTKITTVIANGRLESGGDENSLHSLAHQNTSETSRFPSLNYKRSSEANKTRPEPVGLSIPGSLDRTKVGFSLDMSNPPCEG